jgi:hypothetical protein
VLAESSIRSRARTGTLSNLPILIVGSWPRSAAAYDPLRERLKYFFPASGTVNVSGIDSLMGENPLCITGLRSNTLQVTQ